MLLYKYLCPDRRSILGDRLIRFTPPGQFNDPYDSLPYIEYQSGFLQAYVDGIADSNLKSMNVPERFWKLLKQAQLNQYAKNPSDLPSRHSKIIRDRMGAEVGVLCVTESEKSILMWSHYAARHTGFVLGLDSDSNFFKRREDEPQEIGELIKVDYSQVRISVRYPPINTDPSPKFLFTKNGEWSYEKEWRILRFLKDANKTINNICLFEIPASAIRKVIFGSSSPPDLTEELMSAKKANSELTHVEFLKAELSYNRYEMDIVPVGD
jgi:hypothetical protein